MISVEKEIQSPPYPVYMRVESKEGDIVFMVPRKCAFNSIKHALGNYEYIDKGRLLKGGFITIGVVRHPLIRLVSCWRDKIIHNWMPSLEQDGMRQYMTFAEFLGVVLATPDVRANKHYRSYSDEIIVAGIKPNIVLRVEFLDQDWPQLVERFGLTLRKIGHKNNSGSEPEVVLTRSQINAIEFRYEKDLKNFNYSMEDFPEETGIYYDLDSD